MYVTAGGYSRVVGSEGGTLVRRSLLYVTVLCLVALAAASPVHAQYSEELTVSDTSVPPGGTMTMSGDGFAAETSVTITLESTLVTLGSTTTDGSGAFETTVTIPADTPAGSHTLKATGEAAGGGTLVLSQEIVVGGPLARTGQNVAAWLVIGLGLVGLGVMLVRTRAHRGRRINETA